MQSTRTEIPRIDKQIRADARWKIIQEVNKHRMRMNPPRYTKVNPFGQGVEALQSFAPVTMWGMKKIQQAVNIARRFNLVDDLTLQRAGYNVRRRSS